MINGFHGERRSLIKKVIIIILLFPAGYYLPWLFMKIFWLPVNEFSLYLFNSFLFLMSALLWVLLICKFPVYKDNVNKGTLCFIGGILYVLTPELLHGMGIVFWHQIYFASNFTFALLEIIAYYHYAFNSSYKNANICFIFWALINPYMNGLIYCQYWIRYSGNRY